jgi:phage portal protein BeeE
VAWLGIGQGPGRPPSFYHNTYTIEYKANQNFKLEKEKAKGLLRMTVNPALRNNANDYHTVIAFYK